MELHLERLPKSLELARKGDNAVLRYIDERLLPGELRIDETDDWKVAVEAVKTLAIRGAPALGIAGAAALTLWVQQACNSDDLARIAEEIASARPTAVNLRWGVERALTRLKELSCPSMEMAASALFDLVQAMQDEDERANRAMGAHGAALLEQGTKVLTHCNAGSLATYYYGTALGVVYAAAEQGKIARVYADETRPVGQGARMTAWELARVGVPVTLICDNMAASLMAQGKVDAVIVGADRIARNGDTANKIGTYGVAVLAQAHGIPFYVAAPTSTIDSNLENGSQIIIEQRSAQEVLRDPIEGVDVYNPAFDVTPARLITRIITENGVYEPQSLFAS